MTEPDVTTTVEVVDLTAEYLLVDADRAAPVGGGPAFWERLGSDAGFADRIGRGWLVAVFDMASTWTSWEVHPDGDEIVHVTRGRVRMVFDRDGRHETAELAAGDTVVVPAGVWHTADVVEPAGALHVTFGRDTRHRPR
jgi:mannose-6-phosphate isomerase-like protein (cupin superfamily)